MLEANLLKLTASHLNRSPLMYSARVIPHQFQLWAALRHLHTRPGSGCLAQQLDPWRQRFFMGEASVQIGVGLARGKAWEVDAAPNTPKNHVPPSEESMHISEP